MRVELHKNDIGTFIYVDLTDQKQVLPLADATTKQYKIKKPSGTKVTGEVDLLTDSTDGMLEYVTESGDLNEVGSYEIQVYIASPDWTGHSQKGRFTVYANDAAE